MKCCGPQVGNILCGVAELSDGLPADASRERRLFRLGRRTQRVARQVARGGGDLAVLLPYTDAMLSEARILRREQADTSGSRGGGAR
jgi:hypothetical protein